LFPGRGPEVEQRQSRKKEERRGHWGGKERWTCDRLEKLAAKRGQEKEQKKKKDDREQLEPYSQ